MRRTFDVVLYLIVLLQFDAEMANSSSTVVEPLTAYQEIIGLNPEWKKKKEKD